MSNSRQISGCTNLWEEAMCQASGSWDASGACYPSPYLTPAHSHSWCCTGREAEEQFKRYSEIRVEKNKLRLEPSSSPFSCSFSPWVGASPPPVAARGPAAALELTLPIPGGSLSPVFFNLGPWRKTWGGKQQSGAGSCMLKSSCSCWCHIWSQLTRRANDGQFPQNVC